MAPRCFACAGVCLSVPEVQPRGGILLGVEMVARIEAQSQKVSRELEAAARYLAEGRVVAFPTETVYGLGADAANAGALAEVFRLKGRPSDHPLIVHLADAAQLPDWATDIPDMAWRLAEAFWPGPLTLILRRQPWVPDALTGGQDTVGVRVPAHPLARALLARFGRGVAAPSANRFGHISPTTAAHVRAEFGEAVRVLDGGTCEVGLESTILDLSGETVRVLRPGAVTIEALEAVLGVPVVSGAARASPRVSGSLARHYAPRTPAYLVRDAAGLCGPDDAVLARRVGAGAGNWLTLPDDPLAYAHGLYAALRELDAGKHARLLIEEVPATPAWAAVRDRLSRAAMPMTDADIEQDIRQDTEEIHG